MKVQIEIPDCFTRDYEDKFAELFGRVLADVKTNGVCCGNYERETLEMLKNAFIDSKVQTLEDKSYEDWVKDTTNEIKLSLKQEGYEYDENMSVDKNIGSAMLGEYNKGYNKGFNDEQVKVVNKFVKELEADMPYDICDGKEALDVVYDLAEKYGCNVKNNDMER